jgi:hypothetical protein
MCHDTSTTCADCRLARKRQSAKDRKARQRAADHYAEVAMPLLDVTERAEWIERMLAIEDAKRMQTQRGRW